MAVRQARIFVPNTDTTDFWAETLLGRVIKDLVNRYRKDLKWFWFSRYEVPEGMDDGDCDISLLPAKHRFQIPNQPKRYLRSVRFRFAIDNEAQVKFEGDLQSKVNADDYCIPGGVRVWDLIDGLGNDRFVGNEHRNPVRKERRAQLVVDYLRSTSVLVLDSLVGPSEKDQYHLEQNDHSLNPHGSTFESPHHLFCNITAVPTFAHVAVNGQQLVEIPVKF